MEDKPLQLYIGLEIDKILETKRLDEQIATLKLKPISIDLIINKESMDVLKNISNNIGAISTIAEKTGDIWTKTVETMTRTSEGFVKTTQKFAVTGEIMEKTATGAAKATDNINRQKIAIQELTGAYDKLAKETTRYDAEGTTLGSNETYKSGFSQMGVSKDGEGKTLSYSLTNNPEQEEKAYNRQLEQTISLLDSLQAKLEQIKAESQFVPIGTDALQNQVKAMQDQIASGTQLTPSDFSNAGAMSSQYDSLKAQMRDQVKLIDAENGAYAQQGRMQAEEIANQIKQQKMLADTEVQTASETATKLQGIYDENTQYFQDNADKQIQIQKDIANYQMQSADEQTTALSNAIQEQIRAVKLLNTVEVDSASQTAMKLQAILNGYNDYFAANTKQRESLIKDSYNYEVQAAEDAATQVEEANTKVHQRMNHTGFGLSITEMTGMMISFRGTLALFDQVQQGIVGISSGAAGIDQVFHNQIKNQQQLTEVTDKFIGIAQEYGTSIDQVTQSAKLWGRQYKDVNTALVLTRQATLLSVVDNLSVVDANKAVESSMNAMGMTINTTASSAKQAAQAFSYSAKLVDSWSAVSHSASVSARDLTQGFENSAAAAHQAGLSVDQLNALIAAGVRNTGQSGNRIGNMWKSVLANITSASPKVIEAFNALGVSMTETGKNGVTAMKPTWDILMQLAEASQHANVADSKYFDTISGGRYQFDRLLAAMQSTTTLQNALNVSIHSFGAAQQIVQPQMETYQAALTRLQDAIQTVAFNASSQGPLHSALIGTIELLTNLVLALNKVSPVVYYTVGAIAAFVAIMKGVGSTITTVKGGLQGLVDMYNAYQKGVTGTIAKIRLLTSTNQEANYTASQSNAIALAQEKGVTNVTTAVTEETAAIEKNTTVLNEQNAAMVDSVGADTAAAGGVAEVTGAVGALDVAIGIATGGVLLVLGLFVSYLVALSMQTGTTTDKLSELSTQTQTLNGNMQQLTDTEQSNYAQMNQNMSQVQNLSTQYASLRQQLANTKKGTEQYDTINAQSAETLSQLINLVGYRGAMEIAMAKNVVTATQAVIEQKMEDQIATTKWALNETENQIKVTDVVLEQTQKRMQAIQNEAIMYNSQLKQMSSKGFGRESSYMQMAINREGQQIIAGRSLLPKELQMYQSQQSSESNAIGSLTGQLNSEESELAAFKKNPNLNLAQVYDPYGGGQPKNNAVPAGFGTATTKAKGAGSPLSAFEASNPDNMKASVDGVTQALDQVQAALKSYVDTSSPSYRNELKKEIALLHEKQAALTGEANGLYADANNMPITGTPAQQNSERKAQVAYRNRANALMDQVAAIDKQIATAHADSLKSMFLQNLDAVKSAVDSKFNNSSANNEIANAEVALTHLNGTTETYREELGKEADGYNRLIDSLNKTISGYQQQIAKLEELGKTSGANQKQIDSEINSIKSKIISAEAQANRFGIRVAQLAEDATKSKLTQTFDSWSEQFKGLVAQTDQLTAQMDQMQASGGTEKQKIALFGQIVDSYNVQNQAIKEHIQTLQQENAGLSQNSLAWQMNEKEIETWESTANSVASKMKAVATAVQTQIKDIMTQMQKEQVTAIENVKSSYDATIKQMETQKISPTIELADWKADVATIEQEIHTIRGDATKPITMPVPTFDGNTTDEGNTLQNNLDNYNTSLEKVFATIKQFQDFTASSASNNPDAMFGNLKEQIQYAQTLKDTISSVNTEMKNYSSLAKEQESQLSDKIKNVTSKYDAQIKVLQDRVKQINDAATGESRLAKLQDIQQQINQAMTQKTETYINSQGQSITTYNRTTVEKLEEQQQTLLQTYQKTDTTTAINNQITALQNAKTTEVNTLNQQLTNMKTVHAEQITEMQDYVGNLNTLYTSLNSNISDSTTKMNNDFGDQVKQVNSAWDSMKAAVSNGTFSVSQILGGKDGTGGWYGETIGGLKNFNINVQTQLTQLEQLFSTLGSLKIAPPTFPTTTSLQSNAQAAQNQYNAYHKQSTLGSSASASDPTLSAISKILSASASSADNIASKVFGLVTGKPSVMAGFSDSVNTRNLTSGATTNNSNTGDSITIHEVNVTADNATDFVNSMKNLISARQF